MAWNGSDNKPSPSGGSIPRRSPSRLRGLVAALVVIAGALVAFLLLRPAPAPETAPSVKSSTGTIAEVAPSLATNAPAAVPAPPKPKMLVWNGKEYPAYDEHGGRGIVTGYGVRYLTPNVTTNTGINARTRIPPETRPFSHPTDKMIAVLLCTEPGTAFVGEYRYDPTFNEKFLKSLEDPIALDANDPDDVRSIKEAVIETRADLKRRYDAGEDVAQIICDTHRELRELAAYKTELEKQVRTIARKDGMTEKDLDDCLAAANEMLAARGIGALTVPEVFRRGVRLRSKRHATKKN